MGKPQAHGLYDKQVTEDCERVLVTLLRGMGPWRKSVFLIGGLVPRYLVERRPPDVPAHAGTADVDLVVDVELLTQTEAYRTLEDNLKHLGFERAEHRDKPASWRWKIRTERGDSLVLEFLTDDPSLGGGKPQALPTEGEVTAINIPHASMVFDLHDTRELTVELLGGKGRATETIAYANLVSFVCLKAFAYDQRHEPKDAHDLVYCLEHCEGGVDTAARRFLEALQGKHAVAIAEALDLLRRRFTAPDGNGHRMDGPVAVALFELPGEGEALRESRLLRQRNANAIIESLLARVRPTS